MGRSHTTRCCSALALIAAAFVTIATDAQQIRPFPTPNPRRPKVDQTPLSLFPIRTIWTLDLNNALTAPAAFAERRGYFAIDGGRLVAYDLTCGDQLWLASIATTTKPAVSPDLLFVAGSEAITAVHTADGSEAWRRDFKDTLAAPLVWDNGWLIAATHEGHVVAFRGTDGELIWRSELGSPAHAPPALAADRVYVPTVDGRVVALKVETGAVVWEQRLGGAAGDILALDQHLFLGSRDNVFYRLSAKDGEREKPWRTGADVIGLPATDEHNVYFVSLDNVLRALNRRSGNQQWKAALPLRPMAGPVRAADVVIVAGLSQQLPAFTLAKGTAAGDLAPGGDVVAAPYVTDIPGLGATVFAVTFDIAKGATITAIARRIDPSADVLAPLPNPIVITPPPDTPTAPTTPTTTPFVGLPNPITITPITTSTTTTTIPKR